MMSTVRSVCNLWTDHTMLEIVLLGVNSKMDQKIYIKGNVQAKLRFRLISAQIGININFIWFFHFKK